MRSAKKVCLYSLLTHVPGSHTLQEISIVKYLQLYIFFQAFLLKMAKPTLRESLLAFMKTTASSRAMRSHKASVNFTLVATTPVANNIRLLTPESEHYLDVNSQRCTNKIFKTFLIEDFYYLP
jgi:hypothetical protein